MIWTGVVIYIYAAVTTPFNFFIMAAVVAIVMGGSQALSRSLYAQLVPKGKEAEYFGVYEISDKGTSWLCPALFGLALQFTQQLSRGDSLADCLLHRGIAGAAQSECRAGRARRLGRRRRSGSRVNPPHQIDDRFGNQMFPRFAGPDAIADLRRGNILEVFVNRQLVDSRSQTHRRFIGPASRRHQELEFRQHPFNRVRLAIVPGQSRSAASRPQMNWSSASGCSRRSSRAMSTNSPLSLT